MTLEFFKVIEKAEEGTTGYAATTSAAASSSVTLVN